MSSVCGREMLKNLTYSLHEVDSNFEATVLSAAVFAEDHSSLASKDHLPHQILTLVLILLLALDLRLIF